MTCEPTKPVAAGDQAWPSRPFSHRAGGDRRARAPCPERRRRHRLHALPAARSSWPSTASTRSASTSTRRRPASREPDIADFAAFYEPLRTLAPSCRRPRSPRSATSWPSTSRCSRPGATSSRSTSRAASPAPSSPPARRRRELVGAPSRRGGSRSSTPRTACGGLGLRRRWRPPRVARRGRRRRRRRRPRPRDVERAGALVLARHAGVPAPRRAHRRRAGLARRRAEDQADPDLVDDGDHARSSACAPRRRAFERMAEFLADSTRPARRLGGPAHPGARRGGGLVDRGRELFGTRAAVRVGDRPRPRHARRPRRPRGLGLAPEYLAP